MGHPSYEVTILDKQKVDELGYHPFEDFDYTSEQTIFGKEVYVIFHGSQDHELGDREEEEHEYDWANYTEEDYQKSLIEFKKNKKYHEIEDYEENDCVVANGCLY